MCSMNTLEIIIDLQVNSLKADFLRENKSREAESCRRRLADGEKSVEAIATVSRLSTPSLRRKRRVCVCVCVCVWIRSRRIPTIN
jgi:hypothetical protein